MSRTPRAERPDIDAPALSEEQLAALRPAREVLGDAFMEAATKNRGGRPRVENPKPTVTIRLDREVLDHLRASGKGWQTRASDALKALIHAGKL